jgi:acyl carrier protein
MIKENVLENAIKNYLLDMSGVEIDKNDDIIEMGLIQSMDFIMLISFVTKLTKIELSSEDFNKTNFRSVSAIVELFDLKKNMKRL